MKKIPYLFLASIFIFVTSCNYPKHYFSEKPACQSEASLELSWENPKALRAELKDKSPEDYRYFFKSFTEEGQNTYMITNFRNKKVCFDVKLLVDNWDILDGMKKTNGDSYPSELYDLQWEVIALQGKATVKYLDMHRIID